MNIKYTIRGFFVALIVLASLMLNAQPIFDHITSEDGLSENVVNCIFQDDQGLMWFGTNDGLNKYDGYDFTVFKPESKKSGSISSNLVYAITSDEEGNLWVGTTGAGLSKFDPKTEVFTVYKNDPKDKESLISDQVISLFTDSRGWIWIGTNNGISVFDPKREEVKFKNLEDLDSPNDFIHCISEDKKGNVYIASNRAIRRALKTEKIDDIDLHIVYDDSQFSPYTGLAFDHFDQLFFIGSQQLYYHSGEGNTSELRNLGEFSSTKNIVIDDNNEIWVGSYEGLIHYERHERNQEPVLKAVYKHSDSNSSSLNKNLIVSLFKDSHGLIWVGINGGGVNKFNPNRKEFRHRNQFYETSGGNEKIRAVLEDSHGGLWIGTEGDGLYYKAMDKESFVRLEPFSRPFSITEVKIGNRKWIYIGSERAPTLQRIEITKGRLEAAESVWSNNASVFALMQDGHNHLWIGTYNSGLYRYNIDDNGELENQRVFNSDLNDGNSLSDNIIRKLVQDNKGDIWIGTGNGLSKIDAQAVGQEDISFDVFRHDPLNSKSISHNYVLDILESSSGDIWLGTFGGGLNQIVEEGGKQYSFNSYTEESGLPNATVKSILEDKKGNLWISSNKGLTEFDTEEEKFYNYHIKDGLQSNEFLEVAAAKLKSGEMIFGGVNGYNIFDPNKIKQSLLAPDIVLTNLKVLNKNVIPVDEEGGRRILSRAIAYTEEIELKHNENNFSISFSSLDYSAPEQIQYSYILEGFDEKWTETDWKNRNATYTNIPAGDYTLKVKSTNGDGVWAQNDKALRISIDPPFWMTWYAYLFYAGAVFGLLWFLRKYELIGIQEKHQLTVDSLERKKVDELQDLKLNFFTNISHELRTPLTLIIAPLENLMKNSKNLSEDNINQQHHLIFKNAKYLLRLVDQLLDFRKLDKGKLDLEVRQGDIVKFVKEATEPFQFLANKHEIDFTISSEEEKAYLWFDTDIIEKVLYNLLSNAFKFTPNGGSINVNLKEVELEEVSSKKQALTHYLQIEIKDTGIGISSKVVNKIFERFYKVEGDKFTKDGAGIGLSFTQSLVKRHYGEIGVVSTKGEGSTFIVKLPMKKSVFSRNEIISKKIGTPQFATDPLEYFSPERPSVMPVMSSQSGAVEAHSNDLPLLLFVDDNSDIRKFIRSGFEDDFRIIDADNGLKALELAKSSLPDIIISDIMMPEMNGIELCNHLKDYLDTSHIPVVLLTAKTNVESEIEGLKTGADAYLKKPFKLDVLKQQILNIYTQREKLKSRFRQEIILQPSDVTVTSADEEFLQRAMDLIEEHMSDAEFNVEALVKEMYISRSKLYLKVKALTGQSTSEFIRTIRLKRAVQLLEKSDYTIKEIMFMTGFNTASYFSKCFKKQYGIVPSEYMRNKENLNLAPVNQSA